MNVPESEFPSAPPEEGGMSAAREMSLHMLRMLETRMDAAGIAIQGETQLLLARLQLKLFAAAAIFIAIWGGIVLLAIALPPNLRVPVLSLVVVGFIGLGIGAQLMARKKASSNEIGSLHWFLDSLRQDLEVLSRALARPAGRTPPMSEPPADKPPQATPPTDRSTPSDLAA